MSQSMQIDVEAINQALSRTNAPVYAISRRYELGTRGPEHSHPRMQIWCCRAGVAVVRIGAMRWLLPAGHGLIIPSHLPHASEVLSPVHMQSIYVAEDMAKEVMSSAEPRLVEITQLADCLVRELLEQPETGGLRQDLIMRLLLDEVARLPSRPLGLPFPAEPRLAALCAAFLAAPSARASIDDWAAAAGMSRRSFTRSFRQETGLSFVTWRQQACIVASLPGLARGRSVTEVAFDAGYDSIAAFTTMFRRMLGTAPSQYQRQYQRMQVSGDLPEGQRPGAFEAF